jgi:DNA-binding response OmpR family regulator
MRGKPHRKGHHARPRTVRPKTDENQPASEGTSASSAPSATATKRKCVLVVEDNATIGGLLVALLREEGYRALRAWDGREAMKMARDRRPDLIVLDLSLPYRDGVDVLRELRANDDTVDAPIVVVSGNAMQLTPDDRALVTDTVAKPFDIDRLMNVFRRHLGDDEVDVPERAYGATDTHLHSW